MAKPKNRLNPLTPIAVMLVAWLLKKSAKKTKKVVAKKRGSETSTKTEDLIWKVGLGLALAGAEALVTALMNKSQAEDSSDSAQATEQTQNKSH